MNEVGAVGYVKGGGDHAVDFSLNDLLDPKRCYDFLVSILHPDRLTCPTGHSLGQCIVHKSDQVPLLQYLCRSCGRSFNAFSSTILQGTYYKPVHIVQLLRGIIKGEPTTVLARELGVERKWLLQLRHRLQEVAVTARLRMPLPYTQVEVDELFQNAGEKGETHPDPLILPDSGQSDCRAWYVG